MRRGRPARMCLTRASDERHALELSCTPTTFGGKKLTALGPPSTTWRFSKPDPPAATLDPRRRSLTCFKRQLGVELLHDIFVRLLYGLPQLLVVVRVDRLRESLVGSR